MWPLLKTDLTNVIDTLRECHILFQQQWYRVAEKIFRNVLRNMDLAALFWGERNNESAHLPKWYDDNVINHVKSRKCLGKIEELSKHGASSRMALA